MKKLLFIFFLLSNQAMAYDIDPATGFIVGLVPESIEKMLPARTATTNSYGSVYMSNGYSNHVSYSSNNNVRSYITSSGGYQVSRAGSTTFITQISTTRR
jgi:hypothetical protein